ncbi:GntR family transcriptional regulator [Pusillimonas sp. SM2304]|uniref:GntR family transcriptional regulator n=1 Tax=Pusillimonas sp. SM2304 TaxID=3073241 RepID=UPI0028760ADC|nr:GntR family transcriptional regulator [Pusillimonas sp. SM2304]MDS1140023.1 GntR family transcriptional regulator [Pusillimonas sp. SM2304]
MIKGMDLAAAKREAGIPLYVKLTDVLRHKIAEGVWPTGELIPTLEELVAEHGLARSTVRRAVGALIDEGLLKSGRGIGTVVVKKPDLTTKHLRATINERSSDAGDFQIKILSREYADTIPMDGLAPDPGNEPFLALKKIHIHKGNPFVLMHIYIPKSLFDRFPAGSEKQRKLANLVYEYSPSKVRSIRQTIMVEPADNIVATTLNYGFSAPVAKVIRRFLDARGRLVYCGVFWYRGDGFVMDMELPGSWLAENQPAVAPDNKY